MSVFVVVVAVVVVVVAVFVVVVGHKPHFDMQYVAIGIPLIVEVEAQTVAFGFIMMHSAGFLSTHGPAVVAAVVAVEQTPHVI